MKNRSGSSTERFKLSDFNIAYKMTLKNHDLRFLSSAQAIRNYWLTRPDHELSQMQFYTRETIPRFMDQEAGRYRKLRSFELSFILLVPPLSFIHNDRRDTDFGRNLAQKCISGFASAAKSSMGMIDLEYLFCCLIDDVSYIVPIMCTITEASLPITYTIIGLRRNV